MYCVNCGLRGAKNDFYCYHCGLPLSEAGPVTSTADTSEPAPGRWRGGQVALGILLILVSIFPVTGIALGLGKLAGQYGEAVATWESSHLMGFAILVVVWYLALRPHRLSLSSLGLTAPTVPMLHYVFMTAGALGASLLATALYAHLVNLANLEILSPPDIPSEIVFPGPAVAITFQALALWTPLTEEIFFRGFVFAGLVPRLGVGRAMVGSALIFSVFHIDPRVMLPIFFTGLLLALLYHRTGSLWPCIAAHAGQNALAIVMTRYGG